MRSGVEGNGAMKLAEWMGFIGLAISLWILWHIRGLLLLVFTAVIIATALNSFVRKFQKIGIRRTYAIPLVAIGSLTVMVLFFILVVPPFIIQFQNLLDLFPKGFEEVVVTLDSYKDQLPDWVPDLPSVSELVGTLQPSINQLFGNFLELFTDSLTVLLRFLLVLVLAVMMLADPRAYRNALLLLFPAFYRHRADRILSACEVALRNWLVGISINSLFIFSVSAVGLAIFEIPFVLAHALIAGVLNFIPNIGPVLSVIFPMTIALTDEPWKAIAVLILYVVIQQIESYWLTPIVMAKQVSLLPAVTLIAQVFFATTFGFLGLVLALPLTVIAKPWIQELLIKDILNNLRHDPLQRIPGAHPEQPSTPKPNDGEGQEPEKSFRGGIWKYGDMKVRGWGEGEEGQVND